MFIKTCPFRTAAVASAEAVASASLASAEGMPPESVVRGELRAIIEITSGDSYESYVNKHLFEPAVDALIYPAGLSCVPVSQTTFVGYQLGLSDKPAGIEFRSTADGGMESVVSTRVKPLVARKLKS